MSADRALLTLRRLLRLTTPSLTLPAGLRFSLVFILVLAAGLALAALPLELSFLLVSGFFFTTAALIRPVLTLYILVPIIPFSSLLAVSVGNFRVGLMELVLAVGLAAWAVKLLATRSLTGQPVKIKRGFLTWGFVLLLSGIILSWLNTLSLGASLVETVKWIEMAALYLLVVNLLPINHIKWVVVLLIGAGLVQALLGLYQFIFKIGPEGFLLFDGRFLRAYGTFAQPNPYGGYLGLMLPLALSLTIWTFSHLSPLRFTSPSASRLTFLLNLFMLSLPLGLLLAALFASQSRGAWVGFTAAAIVTVIIRSKKLAVGFAIAVLIGVTIGLVSSFGYNISRFDATDEIGTPYEATVQRVVDAIAVVTVTDVANTPVTDANFATLERLAHWQAAAQMWQDNFWLGVGFGNYEVVYPAYAVGRWLDPLGHAHNYLLNIGAEAGLVGITVYLIFWILTFGLVWYAVRNSRGFDQAVAAGIIGIIVHLHVHNLVDNLYVQGMYLHIAIVIAIASVIYDYHRQKIIISQ